MRRVPLGDLPSRAIALLARVAGFASFGRSQLKCGRADEEQIPPLLLRSGRDDEDGGIWGSNTVEDGTTGLHQVLLLFALAGRQGAAAVQLLPDEVEAEDTGLELLREALEEWRFARVFEEVEGSHDGVGVAARLHQPLKADGT